MKTALIIHGAYGNPDENWIPWLKKELETQNYEVIVPTFPTPEDQNLENWTNVVTPHLSKLNEDSVIVGHSIGATFGLTILEMIETRIDKTILVAGFLGKLGNEFDAINTTIAEKDFNWDKIRNNSKEFFVLAGDNDPYVPLEKLTELGEKLEVEPIIIPNGGHLNAPAGFTEFPKLIELI